MAKSHRARRPRRSAPQSGALKTTIDSAPASLPPPADTPECPPALSTIPKCPRCGTGILNPLRRNCGLCTLPLPLAVRDPSKASLPDGIALPDDSVVRETALRIVALRQAGLTDEEIAPVVKLHRKTLASYVYKAGRNGWLDDVIDDPREQMDYQIFSKVVARLDEALDDDTRNERTGMPVKTAVALKVGEGTLFNRPVEQAQVMPGTTIVGVKIEMVGESAPMREGTVMGVSKYVLDGTVVEGA